MINMHFSCNFKKTIHSWRPKKTSFSPTWAKRK